MLRLLACVLLLTAASFSVHALADTSLLPAKQDVAGARGQSEFDPVNIRLGTWIVSPVLRLDGGYDDNLFGTATNGTGDGFYIVSPTLNVKSDWGRNGLDFMANGIFTRYLDHPKQKSNEYDIHGGGQLDMGRVRLSASAAVALTSERRGANGAPLSSGRPSQFRSVAQKVQIEGDISPVRLSLQADHSRISYTDLALLDGRRASQSFRNSDQWSLRGGATYQPTDITALGLFALYRHSDSVVSSRANELISAGSSGAVDLGLVRIEVEAGYMWQRYRHSTLRNFNGLTYAGTASWYPTPLLTIRLSGRRSLENSGSSSVGVIVSRSAKADIDYELLRNFLINLNVSRKWQNFREIRSHALSRSEELKGEYKFNRTVAIGAYARHECRDSSDTAVIRNFCATLAGLSLTFRR